MRPDLIPMDRVDNGDGTVTWTPRVPQRRTHGETPDFFDPGPPVHIEYRPRCLDMLKAPEHAA